MAIRSQYEDSTFATSIICSSASPSITSFNLNSIGQASLPGWRTTASPPISCIPSSKLVLVLIDGLKKSNAIDLFFKLFWNLLVFRSFA